MELSGQEEEAKSKLPRQKGVLTVTLGTLDWEVYLYFFSNAYFYDGS